ncbi:MULTISPECIES: metallophosphoesterase [Clostridia]|uniref:metallophosphoesterase n=1 Tax=Clostridia TaxID=186801 RepID=UPI00067F4B81|nr:MULTISPECIES: metallophosphoesterase [Clostridia]
MEEISFIHLSDIHFRKTSGNSTDIDNDLRNAVLTDVRYNAKEQLKDVKGILIGGDIAFAGQKEEYVNAKKFLKSLVNCLDIDEKSIYCVPGNHDVNQQMVKDSISIYSAQHAIEEAKSIDDADWFLDKHMQDMASPNLLFRTMEEYNDFSAPFGCNINSRNTFWTASFQLDYNMKLKIRGMNSCIISNHEDHKVENEIRKMVVGQSQIPLYEEDTVWVSLCHHPVEFWKFLKDMQNRLDKRFDIQLYGHKHEQSVNINSERLVVSSGATQPSRGKDWVPRYNWISFKCYKKENDRYIKVKVFPRILSPDRDRFIADYENCDSGKKYFQYDLNIDEKRRKNLSDSEKRVDEKKVNVLADKPIKVGVEKDIIYYFFELSYIQQQEILSTVGLLKEEYQGKRYAEVIEEILSDAEDKGCLKTLSEMIKKAVSK